MIMNAAVDRDITLVGSQHTTLKRAERNEVGFSTALKMWQSAAMGGRVVSDGHGIDCPSESYGERIFYRQ
jgi:hypothetical protein